MAATAPGRTGLLVRAAAIPAAVRSGLAVLVLAGLGRLLYGGGAIGYDASFALVWGRQIAHGSLPQFKSPVAPTPHPLANIASAPLSLLGDHAFAAVLALSFLSLAALTWFGFELGSRLFHPAVGALFALLLFTRPALVNETLQALIDIPFLALVAAAAAGVVAGARPRYVLVLLLLGGLLRPEGWPLALLYGAYCWRGADTRGRAELVALALAAPVIWFTFDAIVTGDPLYSLHGTQSLAANLDRPVGTHSALVATPQYLRNLLETGVAWLGLAGCLGALWVVHERALGPAAIAGAGLAGFIVLGSAGLPVLTRYLLVPACILALFAAVAALGWLSIGPGEERRWWSYVGVLAGIVLLVTVPVTVDGLRKNRTFLGQRAAVQRQLHALVRSGPGRAAVARCRRVVAPEHRPVPLLAYWLGRKPGAIGQDPAHLRQGDAYFAFTSAVAAQRLSLSSQDQASSAPPPPGFRQVAGNASWRLLEDCP